MHYGKEWLLLLIIVLCGILEVHCGNPYCNPRYNCKEGEEEEEHFVCKYAPCRLVTDCEFTNTTTIIGTDDWFQYGMTVRHNKLRSEVAMGQWPFHPFPAANMAVLSYDSELEFLAATYLSSCIEEDTNICAKSKRGFHVSLSTHEMPLSKIISKRGIGPSRGINILKHVFYAWSHGAEAMDKESVENACTGKKCNVKHLAWRNMIWARSQYVGCSRMLTGNVSNRDETILLTVACFYGPQEMDFHDKSVYKIGPPCSDCESSYYPRWRINVDDSSKKAFDYVSNDANLTDTPVECNLEYKGLCGQLRSQHQMPLFDDILQNPNVNVLPQPVFNPDNDTEPDVPGRGPYVMAPHIVLEVVTFSMIVCLCLFL